MSRVVITDCDHGDIDAETKVFSQAGVSLELAQARTEAEVIAVARDADGLIVQYAPITAAVIDACPNLRVVARYGVGIDPIDVEAATERGIAVCNVAGYCNGEVADHALALMLASLRRVAMHDRLIRDGKWDFRLSPPVQRIHGQVLGLVGCGRIGEALAERARALGMTIVFYDPYRKTWPSWMSPRSLESLLGEADVVSLHLGLTAETRQIIGAKALTLMKPGAILVNTARGGLVDGMALAKALVAGKLGGAALDVFDPEPIPAGHPILDAKNTVFSPHMAFYSQDAIRDLKTFAATAVRDVLVGHVSDRVVNAADINRRGTAR